MTFHNYITQDSSLSPRVRELLILRTAWLHGSDVIWRERVPFARKAGLTNEEIRKIAQGPAAAAGTPSKRTCSAWRISCSGIPS